MCFKNEFKLKYRFNFLFLSMKNNQTHFSSFGNHQAPTSIVRGHCFQMDRITENSKTHGRLPKNEGTNFM